MNICLQAYILLLVPCIRCDAIWDAFAPCKNPLGLIQLGFGVWPTPSLLHKQITVVLVGTSLGRVLAPLHIISRTKSHVRKSLILPVREDLPSSLTTFRFPPHVPSPAYALPFFPSESRTVRYNTSRSSHRFKWPQPKGPSS